MCAEPGHRLPVDGRDVVVVLNYRGRADTEDCVAALLADPAPPAVIVVDNGSGDGVLEAVRSRWPDVVTHQTGTNLGFAGGMNAGLRMALGGGARTVTVLNNDTVVPAGAVSALAARALHGDLVSPVVRRVDSSVWFAGGVVNAETGVPEHIFDERLARLPVDGMARQSDVLAGCCLTATAETWGRIGLFDERYFLMFEDSDLSLRARAAGVPRTVLTDVQIEHKVSASFQGAMGRLGAYYFLRNALLLTREHGGGSLSQRWRLLRTRVLPNVTAAVRQRDWPASRLQLIVIGAALGDHARRKYGRASEWLEAR
ncbi:glycosyltransferase family 2 protein [Demetria terragena]|uniref:glycosyltransferase family 2 protein n=1 Tax=Demetria terragena TaxID=63959 RepID=UPI00037B8901|nr:glycosyltransferase family 2 protein [Demetria terragena]